MPESSNEVQRSRDSDFLRAAFGREGCPVCTAVLEYVEQSIDNWEYEGFTDVAYRHQLIRSRGFCPLHTWQLAQRPNAFMLGLIYNEVLTDVLHDLDRDYSGLPSPEVSAPKRMPGWKGWWRRWHHQTDVEPRFEQCPLCRSRTSAEERLTSTLVHLLRSEEIRTLLSQSTGLCLVHFTQARQEAEMHDPVMLPHLLACQRICTRRVLEEVRELVRKHDYRFSDEPRGDEMLSWRRAAKLCAGNPGVR